MTDKIRGRAFFHSETGTEGGHWAVQDERFIEPPGEPDPEVRYCRRCGRYWGPQHGHEAGPEPKPSFTYFSERTGFYEGSDHPVEGGRTWFRGEEPGSFNDEFTKAGNAKALECYENGHDWAPQEPHEKWSYEGLHVLRDGDRVTFFERDGETVRWSGEVELIRHPLFTEDASGMWIHADQAGVQRDEWAAMFFEGLPCELERAER